MSWDHQSGGLSVATEERPAEGPPTSEFELSLATLIRARGAAVLQGLEQHVPGSHHHADGTAAYTFATAVELGLERDHAEAVRETARLHEIGKIYVPRSALEKHANELTPDERALLSSHFAYGAELARGAGIPQEACEWLHATQERFDGRGPAGLAGETIPLESRIIRVACTYDAMISGTMQNGVPASQKHLLVIGELQRSSGHELDPRVIDALSSVVGRAAGPQG